MKIDRKKRRAKIPLLTLLITAGVLAFAGIAAARYTMQKSESGLIAAGDFYFTSDFLKESAENAEYFVDPTEDIIIHLYNYADSLRTTQKDIQYSVKVTGGTCSASNGVLSSSSASSATLTVSQTGDASSVTVTVSSTEPYKKELTASFKREKGNLVTIEDAVGQRAAVLTMTCADGEKDLTINLPARVIPDQANDNVTSFTDSGTCTFLSPGHGVYSLVLLKSDPQIKLTVASGWDFADKITVESESE